MTRSPYGAGPRAPPIKKISPQIVWFAKGRVTGARSLAREFPASCSCGRSCVMAPTERGEG